MTNNNLSGFKNSEIILKYRVIINLISHKLAH